MSADVTWAESPRSPGLAGAPADFRPRRSAAGLGLVVALHLLLAWALVSGLAQRMVEVVRSPIETRLIEEKRPEPPPPPTPLPTPTLPPPPAAVQLPVPEPVQITPPAQAPLVRPAPPPPPVAAVVTTPAPPVAAPPAPAPPPAAATPAQTPEQIYAARLLSVVNSIKRYPTSREARQLRPEGTVMLWLEIDRSGALLDAGVETSSGVLLLDNEALRTVRNGRFPAIPAEAFAGQSRRRFVVAMEYLRPGG